MPSTLTDSSAARLLLSSDTRPRMAKASARTPELDAFRESVGRCIDEARRTVGWSLKELSDALSHNERQVARWIAGTEHPQLDVLFAVRVLRAPLVVALARLADDVSITTHIEIRRTA